MNLLLSVTSQELASQALWKGMLELSQMSISEQTHYLKSPLDRVSRQARYAYLLTLDSQQGLDGYTYNS